MFSDCVCVVIKNASDLAKSTADAKKNLSVFLTALSAYDDASTFVLGVPSSKDTKNLREMLSSLSKMGAMCREVKAPVEHDKVIWAVEYAKSIGKNLSALVNCKRLFTECQRRNAIILSNDYISGLAPVNERDINRVSSGADNHNLAAVACQNVICITQKANAHAEFLADFLDNSYNRASVRVNIYGHMSSSKVTGQWSEPRTSVRISVFFILLRKLSETTK